jgi:tRNA pseudouridine65 synthase
MSLRILYRDPFFVAVDKPAGFYVHPPEDKSQLISRSINCLSILRDQLGAYLYPVHRLDRATSGVLLYALDTETASRLCGLFQEKQVTKVYYAVTRGWIPDEGVIDAPLRSDFDSEERKDAVTKFSCLARMEIQSAVGRYTTARYSMARVEPLSGRMHQIRRHFAHLSHPLIGDSVYGDGKQNRFFRENLKIPGLLLKAHSLELSHPMTGELMRISGRWSGIWHRVFDHFGVCPVPTRNLKSEFDQNEARPDTREAQSSALA